MDKNTAMTAAALAAFSLAAGCASKATTGAEAKGECHGVNACKGQGECGGTGHACSGKNACKGQGWIALAKADCVARSGTYKK